MKKTHKKKKKNRKTAPKKILFAAVVLTCVSAVSTTWALVSRAWYLDTPYIQSQVADAEVLESQIRKDIDVLHDEDERIQLLIRHAENKDIVYELIDRVDNDLMNFHETHTEFYLMVVELDELKLPFDQEWELRKLKKFSESSSLWEDDAKEYYALATAYYRLLIPMIEFKEAAALQEYDIYNADEAVNSHTRLLEIGRAIVDVRVLLEEQGNVLVNLTSYFEKEIAYREKLIAFYRADAEKDIGAQKSLQEEIDVLKEELDLLDPFGDLITFESETLEPMRKQLEKRKGEI